MIQIQTRVACPAVDMMHHRVSMNRDGTYACDCEHGVERGAALAGKTLLGVAPPKNVRGCGALIALCEAAPNLLILERGTADPDFGLWRDLRSAYRTNRLYQAALDRAEKAAPERHTTHQLIASMVGKLYGASRSALRKLKTYWDHEQLEGFVVRCYDGDDWGVPYMPSWKEMVYDRGCAEFSGKLVVGVDGDDVLIIDAGEHDGSFAVRRMTRKSS